MKSIAEKYYLDRVSKKFRLDTMLQFNLTKGRIYLPMFCIQQLGFLSTDYFLFLKIVVMQIVDFEHMNKKIQQIVQFNSNRYCLITSL